MQWRLETHHDVLRFSFVLVKVNVSETLSISSTLIAIDVNVWERDAIKKQTLATRRVLARYMLTVSVIPTLPTTRYQRRAQKPVVPKDKTHDPITYHSLEGLGAGGFGHVRRVMDLRSGEILAVNTIHVGKGREKEEKEDIKKEVELLASCNHVGLSYCALLVISAYSHIEAHIVEFVHSQGWKTGMPVEILCPLPRVLGKTACQG